ncbi:type II toxin-antitoxin system VapC family toxin [Fulvivirgaceae bacterium BMA10]|uniref:Type II toxin-antitoxin system VapC family toxin n=1 Tax=Splendidivirga corallicola TaxID=3051826 RepID=A0ABT8KNN2_9BACT|nr:type II toxin-antitoxin system VapC family toxin [Fulvivirgaceae bacterium BMA10]
MTNAFLLDTHTLLWFLEGSTKLSQKVKNTILDKSNSCYISMASLWEMAIKIKLGKLELEIEFQQLAELLYQNNINIIQISFEHIQHLLKLEDVHRDPFDRIIISQAIFEKLIVISKDENFSKYKELKVIW